MADVIKNLQLEKISAITSGDLQSQEAIVFLHGWGGCKELWWNSLYYLSNTAYCIALDLPGTGDTAIDPSLLTMQDMAKWVYDTCTSLNLHRVTLVGHSMGGNLASQIAISFPAFVKRLILVDAAIDTTRLPKRAYITISPYYGMLSLHVFRLISMPICPIGKQVPHNHTGGYWYPLARRVDLFVKTSRNTQALQLQMRMLCENKLEIGHLQSIGSPIFFIHGRYDGVIPVSLAQSYSEQIIGSRIKVYDSSHHCPMDHEPAVFASDLQSFIDDFPIQD